MNATLMLHRTAWFRRGLSAGSITARGRSVAFRGEPVSLFPRPHVRLLLCLAALFGLIVPGAAPAEVEIAFYSRELGTSFPHAFVTMKGTLDETGEPIDEAFGFTAKAVTPAILMGSVAGKIIAEHQSYISASDRQFTVTASDAEYRSARAVVEQWRNREQPSYNLNRRNCVHFVAEIAEALGLRVDYGLGLMKKPRSFLLSVRDMNQDLLQTRGAGAIAAR